MGPIRLALGELDGECRAGAEYGIDPDQAAMLGEYLLRDGEPEAGSARTLGGREDLEDVGQILGGDAHSIVGDGNAGGGRGLVPYGAEQDTAAALAVLGGIDGVGHDVEDRAM